MFKIKGLRWWIISLIAIATIINYIDRSAINIMWPYIYKDFGIADADNKNALALITSFFMVAYAIGQTLTGKMMDAIGTKMGMAISIGVWSIAIALHALAKSLMSFNVFRMLLGVSEAGNWPGATKTNAEWFPSKERAIAQGIFGAGASLGSVISAPVIALLYLTIGWKGCFAGIAVLGFIWIIPWMIVNKTTPNQHPWITEEEKNHIAGNPMNSITPVVDSKMYTWRELFKFKSVWSIIAARFFIDPVWWLFVTWLPTFLKEQYTFDIKQIGAFAWAPYLMAAIGGIGGGLYSSFLIRKGALPTKARKQTIAIGSTIMLISLVSTVILLQKLPSNPTLAIILIGFTLFGFQVVINNLQTLPSDIFHAKNVGTVSGMGGTAAVVGILITTWMVPILTQTNYESFFILGAILVPLSYVSLRFFPNSYKI